MKTKLPIITYILSVLNLLLFFTIVKINLTGGGGSNTILFAVVVVAILVCPVYLCVIPQIIYFINYETIKSQTSKVLTYFMINVTGLVWTFLVYKGFVL